MSSSGPSLARNSRLNTLIVAVVAVLMTAALVTRHVARAQQAQASRPGGQPLNGLKVFPADDVWNRDISHDPIDAKSATFIASIGPDKPLHPDFGSFYEGHPMGIPYILVPGTQPRVNVTFSNSEQSDPGPYPIPHNAPIEGDGDPNNDRHVLVIDRDNAMLYELYAAVPQPDGSWKAESGAVWNLRKLSYGQRPIGWTSADAAGLPIFPGLARYDEVVGKHEIDHALRFSVPHTRRAYTYPASHFASSLTSPNLPPMGIRMRLRADYDISDFPENTQVILRALKKYGMILADNGSPMFISGAFDPRWDNDEMHTLTRVKCSDFEVIQMQPPPSPR